MEEPGVRDLDQPSQEVLDGFGAKRKKKKEMHTMWNWRWLCQCLCSESLSGRTLRWKRDALRLGTLGLTLRRSAFSSLYVVVERNEEILTSLRTEAGDNRGG